MSQATIEAVVLTEDEFDNYFTLQMNRRGTTVLNESEVANAEPSCIWTMIAGDNDATYLVSGFRYTDAIGYSITDQPVAHGESYEVRIYV